MRRGRIGWRASEFEGGEGVGRLTVRRLENPEERHPVLN